MDRKLHGSVASSCVLLAALLLTMWESRAWMEASMLRHMLLQLPLLAGCGALAVSFLPGRWTGARFDAHGLAGLASANLVVAYWMIPRALELSLQYTVHEVAKCLSLLAIGAVLPGSLRRAGLVIQLFFLANLCAMMAIAGLVYQDGSDRLCNAYLIDDQDLTGGALVALALGLGAIWCVSHYRELAGTADSVL